MFHDVLLDVSQARDRKRWTIGVSLVVQTFAVAIVFSISFMYAEPLPKHALMAFLVAPPLPPPPRAMPANPVAVRIARKAAPQNPDLMEPVSIPAEVRIIHDDLQAPGPQVGIVGVPRGTEAAPNMMTAIIVPPPPPPPPPVVEPAAPQRPLRVATIDAAKIISQPKPVYPPLARQTRTQGTVRLEAIISKEGRIENLAVISGHPLLIQAAMEAVKQWRYQPTLLNGAPVEVITTIEVNFTLGG
jgi:protein TonB